jgi:hypothetical protein
MPNLLIKFLIILIILIIIGIILFIYIRRHNLPPTSSDIKPNDPTDINDSVATGGVYLLGTGNKLIYKTVSGDIYSAGDCSNCPTACVSALPIEDIYTFISCNDLPDSSKTLCNPVDRFNKDKYVPVLIKSAEIYTNELLAQSKGILTLVDCVNTLNPGTSSIDKLQNEQVLKIVRDALVSGASSIWDFFSNNKSEIIDLIGNTGEMFAYSAVFKHFAIFVMLIPSLDTERGRIAFATFAGFELTKKVWTKYVKIWLDQAIKSMTVSLEEKIFEEASGKFFEYSLKLSAELLSRVVIKGIVYSIRSALEIISFLTEGVFFFIDFLMIVGMIVDAFDPCGLNQTLSGDDVAKISDAFNEAYYRQTLQGYNTIPVEWYAENIAEYNIICGLNDINSTALSSIVFADDNDPCKNDNDTLRKYSNIYFDALKVNSFGQCIQNVSNEYIKDKLTTLGFPTNQWNASQLKLTSSDFSQLVDYLAIQAANQNIIVAAFLKKYILLVIVIIILVILIAFLL